MPGSPARSYVLLASLAVLTAGLAGCDRPSAATASQAATKAARPVTRVEVVRPERRAIRREVEEPGQVEAFEVTAIHANVVGYVKSWGVNIGSKITKGQMMAELDVPELTAEAEQKRAMVEQAEARRDQAEAAVEVAGADVATARAKVAEAQAGIKRASSDLARWRSEYNRVEQLFRERAQTGSLLDETRNKLSAAEAAEEEELAQVETARAALAQARAALDKARSDLAAAKSGIAVARADARRVEALLGYTKIVAPYDGVVTRRNVDTGHLTMPGAQGEPLFVVARSDLVTVVVAVPEMDAPAVDPGDRARVRLQALPGKVVEGRVTRTAYALDTKSRTLRAEIDLPNPEGKLHPGLYAYATITVEESPYALTLPATAVGRDGDKTFCVAVRDGHAARLPIELGLGDGARFEVRSGLKGDEVVAKANVAALADGQAVEPLPSAKPAASGAKP
ncbi:MAG TPA: efflux RND transporter periplasmic adaptor subunit [Isosphaeraceae bacterium]|jgi:RND family efflux transporter MFP subunit|nr:efflux RND transporter periplasmic adaptor subunit [Isosphaeraceae bacterium]